MENVSSFSQSLPWHMNESLATPHHHCSSWTALSTDAVMDVWNLCTSSVTVISQPSSPTGCEWPGGVPGVHNNCFHCFHCNPGGLHSFCLKEAASINSAEKHTAVKSSHRNNENEFLCSLWSQVALCEEAQVALCPLPSKFKRQNTLKTEMLQHDAICLLD